MVMLNDVFLAGTLARDPEPIQEGAMPYTTARLCVEEPGKDGQTYRVYVPVECWGKAAEALAALREGDIVLLKGKLKWRAGPMQDGKPKQGTLVVSAWSVQTIQVPAVLENGYSHTKGHP